MAKQKMSRMTAAETNYFAQYGRALAEWATLERILCWWFVWASGGITNFSRGINVVPFIAPRAVFYSVRTAKGRIELIEAAMNSVSRDADLSKFMKHAFKRLYTYSQFRNNLAHDVTVSKIGSPQLTLARGKDVATGEWFFGNSEEFTVRDIRTAARNFWRLRQIMTFVHPDLRPHPLTPKQGLAQVRKLPPQAYFRTFSRR